MFFPAVKKSTYFFRNWKTNQIYINSPSPSPSPSPPRHLHHHCCHCRLFQAKIEKRPEGKTHNRLLDDAVLVRGSFSWLKASKQWGFHRLKYIARGRFHSDRYLKFSLKSTRSVILRSCSIKGYKTNKVTWKAKTDTNALPFNEKTVYYPFNIRLKRIV